MMGKHNIKTLIMTWLLFLLDNIKRMHGDYMICMEMLLSGF